MAYDTKSPERFLQSFVDSYQPLVIRANKAYWEMTTTGSDEAEAEYARTKAELMKMFSDAEGYKFLKETLHKNPPQDELLHRQIHLLHLGFLANQLPTETIDELVRKEQAIEGIFVKFRAEFHGQRVTDNDLRDILRNTRDSLEAKEAWEASKTIARDAAPLIRELVKVRNRAAQSLGFEDYHKMALFTSELDEGQLFKILDDLKEQTDHPFRTMKKKLDMELSERFAVPAESLRPWHYGDPFFQEVPATCGVDPDEFYRNSDPVDLATLFYDGIGLETRGILERSDLYEREGKEQHAYCTDIDRSGDVRTLCNLRPNEQWTSTLLHELGHGVYDLWHDPSLPFILREPAHIFTTEAVAMLMGRLTKDPDFLEHVVKVPSSRLPRTALKEQGTRGSLIFVRWGLVMVYFERELYQNPDQDLDSLWWRLVHELQGITPPDGRQAPDWAAKIHIGTVPVYYQNYLLGELFASQLHAHLKRVAGSDSILQQKAVGAFLKEQIFRPGSRWYWGEMIGRALGEDLDAKYFADEFL